MQQMFEVTYYYLCHLPSLLRPKLSFPHVEFSQSKDWVKWHFIPCSVISAVLFSWWGVGPGHRFAWKLPLMILRWRWLRSNLGGWVCFSCSPQAPRSASSLQTYFHTSLGFSPLSKHELLLLLNCFYFSNDHFPWFFRTLCSFYFTQRQ